MKRYMALLIAAGCLAGYAMAQDTNPVYSVNIVGFNKVTLEKGKLYLVTTSFEDIDGKTLKSPDVFGTQLPANSAVHYYNSGKGAYDSDYVGKTGAWPTPDKLLITYRGGMGLWIKIPANAPLASYEVAFMGQVPMDNQISLNIVPGLQMIAYPYTATVDFTNTALYAASQPGDAIYTWNVTAQTWDPTLKKASKAPYAWPAAALTLKLAMDKGFWYRGAGAAFLATEKRPY